MKKCCSRIPGKMDEEKPAPAKRGRKPLMIDCERVTAYAKQGLNDVQIYRLLGIGHDTFYTRKREMAEFSDALALGRARGEDLATSKLGNLIEAENLEAIKFFLTHRSGWTKTENIKIEGDTREARIAAATVEIGPETRTLLEALGVNTRRGEGPMCPGDFEVGPAPRQVLDEGHE